MFQCDKCNAVINLDGDNYISPDHVYCKDCAKKMFGSFFEDDDDVTIEKDDVLSSG